MSNTVIVGMSGGVDSSVSALLLKQQGYRVIGLYMKNWEETSPDGRCTSAADFEDVAHVCSQLDIPYYTVNFVKEYQDAVFRQFLEDIRAGLTPNPDVLCNREIKFKVFWEKAREMGADYLATGHYCRTNGTGRLLKGLDPDKDQSYFLHAVPGSALKNVLFPVGGMCKQDVRKLAKAHNLPTAEKKDSTGICFIGKRDFKPFLEKYVGVQRGEFRTLSGTVVGHHEGMAFYTIGQRRGMGLGGEGDAWYVVGKDVARNVVFVERGADHPALFVGETEARDLCWVGNAPQVPFRCMSKVRYRQTDQACTIVSMENGRAKVVFDTPQRAVTPGQSIVFYTDDVCLGGGIICPLSTM